MPAIVLGILLFLSIIGGLLNNSSKNKEIDSLKLTASQLEAKSARTSLNAQVEVRSTETELSNTAADIRKTTNEKINSLTSERDTLLHRVRSAEATARKLQLSKATSTGANGQASEGSAGTELLATIGEQDVEEANRADTIRLHLEACYRQYDGAKEALSRVGTVEAKD